MVFKQELVTISYIPELDVLEEKAFSPDCRE